MSRSGLGSRLSVRVRGCRRRVHLQRRKLRCAIKMYREFDHGWRWAWHQATLIERWTAALMCEIRTAEGEFADAVLADIAALPTVDCVDAR